MEDLIPDCCNRGEKIGFDSTETKGRRGFSHWGELVESKKGVGLVNVIGPSVFVNCCSYPPTETGR